MNTSRIAGAIALGAAAALTLAGCIQLPSPQAPVTSQPLDPGTSQTPTQPTADAGEALVDTVWSGSVEGPESGIDLDFTFEADGTLYITRWNDLEGVPFDETTDTWSVEDGTLAITLSQIEDIQFVDLSGPVADGTLTLTGEDGVGTTGYTATFTQSS